MIAPINRSSIFLQYKIENPPAIRPELFKSSVRAVFQSHEKYTFYFT